MHVDRDAWIAAGGDAFRHDLYAALGAVACFAQGSHRALATIHPDLPEIGCVGDWTGDRELLREAEAWLRDRGARVAHGPKELCSWFNARASLGPFEEPPFSWEPTTPAQPWLDAGYTPLTRYVSVLADHHPSMLAGTRAATSLSGRGWTLQALPADGDGHVPEALFHEALGVAHQLFAAGFGGSDGYARVPLEALRAYYGRYRTELDPRLTLLAFDPKGAPAGVILAIPDRATPARKWFCVMTLAVLPQHRQQGVGSWLVAACHKAARDAGYRAGVHALIQVERGQEHPWYQGRILRRYALLHKPLVGG